MSDAIDPRVVELLRCPKTGARLRVEGDRLVSDQGTSYPIRDGIPVLLREAVLNREAGEAHSDRPATDRH